MRNIKQLLIIFAAAAAAGQLSADELSETGEFLDRDDQILTVNIAASTEFLRSCRLPVGSKADWRAAATAGRACADND